MVVPFQSLHTAHASPARSIERDLRPLPGGNPSPSKPTSQAHEKLRLSPPVPGTARTLASSTPPGSRRFQAVLSLTASSHDVDKGPLLEVGFCLAEHLPSDRGDLAAAED